MIEFDFTKIKTEKIAAYTDAQEAYRLKEHLLASGCRNWGIDISIDKQELYYIVLASIQLPDKKDGKSDTVKAFFIEQYMKKILC